MRATIVLIYSDWSRHGKVYYSPVTKRYTCYCANCHNVVQPRDKLGYDSHSIMYLSGWFLIHGLWHCTECIPQYVGDPPVGVCCNNLGLTQSQVQQEIFDHWRMRDEFENKERERQNAKR